MELAEFVKRTLVEIAEGVKNAHEQVLAAGARIESQRVSTIKFDVAVTASEADEASAKGGITVWGIGGGAESKSNATNSTVSRIKFAVPFIMPMTADPWRGLKRPTQ